MLGLNSETNNLVPVFPATSKSYFLSEIDKEWSEILFVSRGLIEIESSSIAEMDLIEFFKEPRKSTIAALLKYAVGWSGNDLDEILEEIKKTRSEISF